MESKVEILENCESDEETRSQKRGERRCGHCTPTDAIDGLMELACKSPDRGKPARGQSWFRPHTHVLNWS